MVLHTMMCRINRLAGAIAVASLVLGGCAGPRSAAPEMAGVEARIVDPPAPLECVPYARSISKVALRGDAWTWWQAAEGRYLRNGSPKPGSVLVLGSGGRSRGHVAVVSQVIDSRLIVVDHANWLNRGRIHNNTPVRDVSSANHWSRVNVWYTPGGHWGARTYPVRGFIHPQQVAARPGGASSRYLGHAPEREKPAYAMIRYQLEVE